MKHLINFFKGMIFGIANVIPGVSGGTIAVCTGIYEKLISIIGNFFKNFKKTFKENMIFLIPIGLGAVIGILAFSRLITYLLETFPMQTNFTFIGLILGSLPLIFKKSNLQGFKKRYIIPGIITFGIGIALTILEIMNVTGTAITSFDMNFGTVISLFLYGFISAASMVIPGISGSFMLLLLGAYTAIMTAISALNIPVLIPFAIGVGLGIIACSKVIDILLAKFYGFTYYAIIGFIIGTLPILYPGFAFNIGGLISIILMIVGFVGSYLLCKLEK